MEKKLSEVKLIDCECNGLTCCGGRGIAVFQVVRDGKKMKVCTRCDLSSDETSKKILGYALKIPAQKLTDFDALGAICLAGFIAHKKYPILKESKPRKAKK